MTQIKPMILGVPSLWRYELLDRLIASALAGTRVPDEILVVDNGGKYEPKDSRVRVIYSGENLGVAASWNCLLRAGAWVISNDDVVFTRRTFEEMASALEAGTLFVNGLGWALFGQRPEVAEKIGFYDERFFPAYYEDDDYEVRLIDAGIATRVPVLSEPVEHVGWASSRKLEDGELRDPAEHQALYRKNCQVFMDKWGGSTDQVKAEHRARREGHAAMLLARERNIVLVNGKPLLGLCMIVKNEVHGIAETLRSFAPYIDYWTIMDTGSTDNTADVVRETLRDIPGDLFTGEFGDFSTARNRALAHHGEKTNWTIMPDADDRLVGGDKLREQLPIDDSGPDGFMVNLLRGHLDYYLPLVLRSSHKLRYVGRVHENVDRIIQQKLVGVEVRQDQPPQSREASKKRWERDALLLGEDLDANPTNPRTLFYLAQTYECLNDKPKAIELYLKRIEVGGWIDETFETHLRLAGIYRATSDDVEADRWLLRAHTFMPERAEPLLKLAQHYHAKDNHALAFLFGDRGAEMPYSRSTLWVDHNAQDDCARIASIHAYYLKDAYAKQAGADHAKDCVRRDPGNSRFRSNWAFYARSVKHAFGAVTRRIDFTPPPGWNASNPSIHYDGVDGILRCVVRTTNYKLVDGCYLTPNDNAIYTRNWMLELTDDLKTTRAVEMVDLSNTPRSPYPVHGFEDCRLYRVADQLMCSATVCDFDLNKPHEGPREIVAMELSWAYEILRARVIRGSWSDHSQKNWMPFERNVREEWLYATINNAGQTTRVTPDQPPPSLDHGRLRGGSQLVRLADNKWLAVVHDVAFPGGRARFYLHRFVLFDEQAERVLSMTDPFYFEKLGIEFCCGLARIGKQLVASFSVDDCSANFAVFDLHKVLAALDEDFTL